MSDPSEAHNTGSNLDPATAESIDAAFAARSGGEDARGPVGDLLAALDTPIAGEADSALVDVTMLRILRSTGTLADADADAFERWAEHAEPIGAEARARVDQHSTIESLVASTPVAEERRADLVDRTLAMIEQAETEAPAPINFADRVRSIRWADLVSVAAMLLIAASVIWPVLDATRARADRLACASNFTTTAGAMGAYAGDNRDALPMAIAGFGGGREWIRVGDPDRSNSANLHTLINAQYATRSDLACAGNAHAPTDPAPEARDWSHVREVSYSYQLPAGSPYVWAHGNSSIVLADRSPVILRVVARQPVDPLENSPNHGDRGQHILRTDGSRAWITSPRLASGDNIWLPRGIEAVIDELRIRTGVIEGSELPTGPEDAFLAP